MDNKQLRLLDAEDIEVRVGQATETWCTLLLYKNARVDMNVLDDWVGPMNWTRHHEVINENLFCTISIYDDDRKIWVSKQDVGTESRQDAQKGEASDAFKRAGFNWGIGRELYTSPFVYIELGPKETMKGKTGNIIVKTKFHISDIEYEDRKISRLVIKDSKGLVRFHNGQKVSKPAEEPAPAKTAQKETAPPKQAPAKKTPLPKAKPESTPPNTEHDMVLPFGKYKDYKLSEIWVSDRNYCEWMLNSDKIKDNVKDILKIYLKEEEGAGEEEPEQENLFNPVDPEDLGDIPF